MTIGLEDARRLVVAAVENAPKGKRNATDGSLCVYDNGKGEHCIVGQVLVDAGLDLPEHNEAFCGAGYAYAERGQLTQSAVDFLYLCQTEFDRDASGLSPTSESPPRTWRQALDACRKKGYLDGDLPEIDSWGDPVVPNDG